MWKMWKMWDVEGVEDVEDVEDVDVDHVEHCNAGNCNCSILTYEATFGENCFAKLNTVHHKLSDGFSFAEETQQQKQNESRKT